MPRAARRLIVAAAAAIVLLVAWCGYIGLFRNAVSDAYLIRLETNATLRDVKSAAEQHRIDQPTLRAAAVRMNELLPILRALEDLAATKQAHRLNIAAAYRYYHLRKSVIAKLEQLQNLRDAIPATTRAA